MLHLQKHLIPLLRTASHPTTSTLSSLHLGLLLSTTAIPFSIEDYLFATCGLTGGQALKASKKLSHLKSASKPDAVLALLSGVGLFRPDFATIIAADPLLLCARVDSLDRRLTDVRDRVGLSDPQIACFLLAGGALGLRSCDVATKLEFWIPFFGSFDKLLQTMRRNRWIMCANLEKKVKPNIALLQECGLSVRDIVNMLMSSAWLLTSNPERLKAFVQRADNLGVPRTSCAFKHAVGVAGCISKDKMAARMEFLRSTLDCSMEKLRAAVCKLPTILRCSEENLRCKIEFMVTEVGFKPEFIVERPSLLTYSLEKRVMPRHYVVKILHAEGLIKKYPSFVCLIRLSEDDFVARYIDNHKGTVPGLADAYAAAHAGERPLNVHL